MPYRCGAAKRHFELWPRRSADPTPWSSPLGRPRSLAAAAVVAIFPALNYIGIGLMQDQASNCSRDDSDFEKRASLHIVHIRNWRSCPARCATFGSSNVSALCCSCAGRGAAWSRILNLRCFCCSNHHRHPDTGAEIHCEPSLGNHWQSRTIVKAECEGRVESRSPASMSP